MQNLTNDELVRQSIQQSLGHCVVANSFVIESRQTTCNNCEYFNKEHNLCSENSTIPLTTIIRIDESICPRSKW
jgi:hypothetical protein